MALQRFGTPGRHSLDCVVPHHITPSVGRCPLATPHSNPHNFLLTPPIEVFLSILESARHKPSNTLGLTLVTPSSCGWEAFQRPGALIHTRITWALSPMAPQVPSVTPGSLLCPWCCGHSSKRGARHSYNVGSAIPVGSSSASNWVDGASS